CKHVFDVGSLQKLQPTELHEWDVAPGQFYFKWAAVMGGAEQNSLRFECEPRFTVFQDLLDDVPGLIPFIAHTDQLRSLGRGTLRPKVLRKALLSEIDNSVCRREDRLCRTIVLIKRNDFSGGAEMTGKVKDVAHCRSPERIDRLCVVSHYSETPAIRF